MTLATMAWIIKTTQINHIHLSIGCLSMLIFHNLCLMIVDSEVLNYIQLGITNGLA